MSKSHTQTKNFHIAPIDRQFVGGLIGKSGSNIKSTVSKTGVQRIYYDRPKSQFTIIGGARACERAINEMSKQLSELISKKIENSAKKSGIIYKKTHNKPTPTFKEVNKTTKTKKRNAFEGLVGEDGRTTEEIQMDIEKQKQLIKEQKQQAKRDKKHKIQEERSFIVGGISWADDLDSDISDDDDEE